MGALAKAGMPEEAQKDLYEMMGFQHEFGYYAKGGLEDSPAVSCLYRQERAVRDTRTS